MGGAVFQEPPGAGQQRINKSRSAHDDNGLLNHLSALAAAHDEAGDFVIEEDVDAIAEDFRGAENLDRRFDRRGFVYFGTAQRPQRRVCRLSTHIFITQPLVVGPRGRPQVRLYFASLIGSGQRCNAAML